MASLQCAAQRLSAATSTSGRSSVVSFGAPTTRPRLASRKACVAPVAAATRPAGVTLPPRQPVVPEPRFGFVSWAEKINGRACMLGFIALLIVEGASGAPFLQMIGLTVGKGLGFSL